MRQLREHPALWALRAVWLLLPIAVGPAMADGFDDRSRAVQVTGALLAWGLWGVGLVTSLIPATVTLTVLRLLAPGAAVLGLWSALSTDDAGHAALAAGGGMIAAVVALSGPGLADAFVNASSYGPEQRVALRVPASLLLIALPLAWTVAAAGVVAGPMLLAAEQWGVGGLSLVAGLGLAWLAFARLHELSRRWLVFVPAGVVVHDPVMLSQPVLFPRDGLDRFGPADPSTDGLDVSGGAIGLVLELRPERPVKVGVREGRRVTEHNEVPALLVCPTRPGHVLELARQAQLPVG